MDQKTRLPIWPFVLFLLLLIDKLYFSLNSGVIKEVFNSVQQTLIVYALLEDLGIFFLILSLASLHQTRAKFISSILIVTVCILYLIDNMTVQALYVRFTLPNIYKFYKEFTSISTFISKQSLIVFATVLILPWLIRKVYITLSVKRVYFFTISLALAFTPWIFTLGRMVDPLLDKGTLNVIRINQQVVYNRTFSSNLVQGIKHDFPEVAQGLRSIVRGIDLKPCTNSRRPNLILLVSESLSQVDSLRSGGLFNRLPRIDRIQAKGLTLTNVIANGSNTSDALAALLGGIEPVPAAVFSNDMPLRFPPRMLSGRNLVAVANQQGYHTISLTNAPLAFEHNGLWLEKLGTDYVAGGTSKLFAGKSLFTFSSPADVNLFTQALTLIRTQQHPFLLTLLTVSLHKPYILPDAQDRVTNQNLLNLLHYIDRTTADFYSELQHNNFFENGYLLLVGDHRRMDPLEPEEIDKRGVDSYGRVVASLIGPSIVPGKIDHSPLNHTDLNTIMRALIKGCNLDTEHLIDYNRNRMLGISKPFTSHLISDDLGLLLIRTPSEEPWIVKFHGKLNPAKIKKNQHHRQIAAYLVLSSAWLGEKQYESLSQ